MKAPTRCATCKQDTTRKPGKLTTTIKATYCSDVCFDAGDLLGGFEALRSIIREQYDCGALDCPNGPECPCLACRALKIANVAQPWACEPCGNLNPYKVGVCEACGAEGAHE